MRADLEHWIRCRLRVPARLRPALVIAIGMPLAGACASAHPPLRIQGEVKRTSAKRGGWIVTYEPPHRPDCYRETICVTTERAVDAAHPEAPFESCASTGPRGEVFREDWTEHERAEEDSDACCYSSGDTCLGGGRPWKDASGASRTATLLASPPHAAVVVDPTRARFWAETARAEHASIASFARFALELLALGAPASLVERAHAAAIDEISHARVALALASKFTGRVLLAGPLPVERAPIRSSPVDVLRATLRDGCIDETRSAIAARERASSAGRADERAALERIADDEIRHAQLAFDAAEWTARTYAVGAALDDELRSLEGSA